MYMKIFCLILIIKLTQARNEFVPKFYGQDSAVIVDANQYYPRNRNVGGISPAKIQMPPPFPLWQHYPRYHIVPPLPLPAQILALNTWAKIANTRPAIMLPRKSIPITSTTTPKPIILTSSPSLKDEEFPAELIEIAYNKLGLKSIDEIPSISELGQLLGTNSHKETLNYIKQLASNEQGLALMKAYIESTDYTDATADVSIQNNDLEYGDKDEINYTDAPLNNNDEELVVIPDEDSNDDYELSNEKDNGPETIIKPETTKKLNEVPNNPSFMERIANYMNLNNLFLKNEKNNENKEYNELIRITENAKQLSNNRDRYIKRENQTEFEETTDFDAKKNTSKVPLLVRESVPFNYPIPIRIQKKSTNSTTASNTPVVHLNTPKVLIPHIEQFSRISNIPRKKIENLLHSKPQLMDLATKLSRFPISYDGNSQMEAQIMTAVRKALEQDDDLQKLLSSTASLK